jgi:Ca2+-binding EF-hand superfamily protein
MVREGFAHKQNMLTCLVLTNLGERMSESDVNELLKGVETKDGTVNYNGMPLFKRHASNSANKDADFVHMILSN